MSKQDCELSRLRIDAEMKDAISEAARRQGITVAAWRKVAYARMLGEQLGPLWRRKRDPDAGGARFQDQGSGTAS